MHQTIVLNSLTKFYTKGKCRATNKEIQDKKKIIEFRLNVDHWSKKFKNVVGLSKINFPYNVIKKHIRAKLVIIRDQN